MSYHFTLHNYYILPLIKYYATHTQTHYTQTLTHKIHTHRRTHTDTRTHTHTHPHPNTQSTLTQLIEPTIQVTRNHCWQKTILITLQHGLRCGYPTVAQLTPCGHLHSWVSWINARRSAPAETTGWKPGIDLGTRLIH